jgi:hypothetical protein
MGTQPILGVQGFEASNAHMFHVNSSKFTNPKKLKHQTAICQNRKWMKWVHKVIAIAFPFGQTTLHMSIVTSRIQNSLVTKIDQRQPISHPKQPYAINPIRNL